MLILDVEAGSAADTASLRIGDILIGIRGNPIESVDALGDALDSADGAVPLQFLRGDRRRVREAVARIEMRAEAA
jgi:S1-C subfamily serine protease